MQNYFILLCAKSKSGSATRFCAYFEQRPHYLVNSQDLIAQYNNKDTDVVFELEHVKESTKPRWEPGVQLEIRIPLLRADFFAREAALSIACVIRDLDLEIVDSYHLSGPEFDERSFFREWNFHNRFAIQRFLFAGGNLADFCLLARSDAEIIWQWNYDRAELAEKLGERVCVPKVSPRQSQAGLLIHWDNRECLALPKLAQSLHVDIVRGESILEVDALHPYFDTTPGQFSIIEFSPEVATLYSAAGQCLTSQSPVPVNILILEEVEAAQTTAGRSKKSCLAPPREWE